MRSLWNPIFWLCFCSVLLLTGCGGGRGRLLEIVPKDCNMVIILDWAKVRNNAGLKRIIKAEMYEKQIQRFGIQTEKVSEMIVFGVMNGDSSQGGLLFRGEFDARKILAGLKSQGWSETTLDERKVYVNGKDYLASTADNILIAGTSEAVGATLRAAKNRSQSISESVSFRKIKDSLSETKSPMTAMLFAPDGTLEAIDTALSATDKVLSFFDAGEIGSLLKMLNIASGVGFTIAPGKNDKYAVKMSVLMRDEKTAQLAATSLNILKSLSAAVTNEKDRETAQALEDFTFSRRENALLLMMQMPEKALLPNNQ